MARRSPDPLTLFPFVPPPTKWPPINPSTRWGARELDWERSRLQRQKGYVDWLRACFAEGEEALIGWPAILAWLQAHGALNREGKPVTVKVARRWMRDLGMPVLRRC